MFEPNIKSIIKNDKNILLFLPGSNIEKSSFTGLNFQFYKNLYEISSEDDLKKYKDKKFDYFFIHGFQLRNFNTNCFLQNNIKINLFCIDLLGEGFDIDVLLSGNQIQSKVDILNCEVKILIPFNHYNNLENNYSNYKFFKYEFGGPRLFCSRYNRHMIHGQYLKIDGTTKFEEFYSTHKFGYNQIVYGISWSDLPKDKLFMCLNGAPRNHRVLMYKSLIEKNLLNFGYVTFQSNLNHFELYLKNDNSDIFKHTISVPQQLLNEDNFEGKFALHTSISKNSYIELVTESHHNSLPFKTEKCVKPFYNLQFPIILGHQGIIEDLRKMDFDMFDDILNHDYDNQPIKSVTNIIHDDLFKKCDIISNELIRLSKLDIHSLYLKNKERFLYNQENLYKKTIIENNIFQDLGKFIFGDDIEVIETNFDKIEKIYL